MAGAVKTRIQSKKREKLIKAGQLKETGDGSVMERVYNKKLKFKNNKVSRSKAINDKVAKSQKANDNKIVEEVKKINFNNKHKPNPLHDFNNFSAVITLIAMTKEEVNFPYVLLDKGDYGKFVIAQTAGKIGNRANTSTFIDRSVKGNLEFLIDNLEIDSIVAPTKRNKHTQATNIRFEITEPYSIGLLIATMKIQAARAQQADASDKEIGAFNHVKAPYALLIDYVGTVPGKKFDPVSNQVVSTNNEKEYPKRHVIPIQFQSIQFRANQGGAVYDCQARPHMEYGLSDINNKIREDITIEGDTVHEILQSGSKSLMHFLNQKGEYNEKAKKYNISNRVPDGEDFVILFPPEEYNNGTGNKQFRDEILRDVSAGYDTTEQDSSDENESQRITNQNILRNYDPTLRIEKLLRGNNENNADFMVNAVNKSDDLNSGGGIQINQLDGKVYTGNTIGSSRMVWDKSVHRENTKIFPDFNDNYSWWSGTYKRDDIGINFKKKQLTFPKGTLVTDIIEMVLILSEYGKKLGESIGDKESEGGYTEWFRIIPQCFELKDSYIEAVTKTSHKLIVCNVMPYGVMNSTLKSDDQTVDYIQEINRNIVKRYDYLYSGRNHDILDFDLVYNNAFYNSVLRDPNNSQSADPGKKGENTIKKTRTTVFGTKDNASGKSSYASEVPDSAGANNQGTNDEASETSFARDFNQRIINSAVDLIDVNVTIHGDPYYLPNSGMSNYINMAKSDDERIEEGDSYMINSDGQINFLPRQTLIELTFISPIDIDKVQGNYIFPTGTINDRNGRERVINEFGGIFRVIEIRSEFKGGRFTQTLRCVRSGNMNITDDNSNTISTTTYEEKKPAEFDQEDYSNESA